MITQDLFDKLHEDPDIPEDLLLELLQHTAFTGIPDDDLDYLYPPKTEDAPQFAKAENENIKASKARQGSPFLSTRQAANYLCLSFRTLEKMRMTDTGPSFRKHGRYVRYHIDDLEVWSNKRGGISVSNKGQG